MIIFIFFSVLYLATHFIISYSREYFILSAECSTMQLKKQTLCAGEMADFQGDNRQCNARNFLGRVTTYLSVTDHVTYLGQRGISRAELDPPQLSSTPNCQQHQLHCCSQKQRHHSIPRALRKIQKYLTSHFRCVQKSYS